MGRYDILLHPPDEPTRAAPGQRDARSVEQRTSSESETEPKLSPKATGQTSLSKSSQSLRSDASRSDVSPAPEQAPPAVERAQSSPRSLPVEPALAPSTTSTLSPSQEREVFGPSRKADQKYTLLFTTEELEALEDVKLELRRRFDLRTTKIELVRISVWDLLEDYRLHGEQSRLQKRLKHLRAQANAQQRTSPRS